MDRGEYGSHHPFGRASMSPGDVLGLAEGLQAFFAKLAATARVFHQPPRCRMLWAKDPARLPARVNQGYRDRESFLCFPFPGYCARILWFRPVTAVR